ncbi:peptide chain release factor 1 [Caproicibacterium lactatifermentans]|jgi:peptide chain release factor 1|uniref:Peptide chain release factor 1 n=1 Tax=Caproicibacterium lactatifermentans TaxID=2666138 RepID=A0ABX6PWL6_9FIRM|nr:peptide chain release factor 1 [Caproicibacterium lactatifermentans]ARP49956.1 peptide chain release factor 1 [Ruminococcaceae bacterium CPB6]QKO30664.1 peptide chain release factor 1 [Caproicibacterium lactatifermentans]
MFENLAVFTKRLEELNVRLCDPTVAADQNLYAQLMKEYSELEPLVTHYRRFLRAQKAKQEAQEILTDSASRDLHGLASQQLKEAEQDLDRLTEEIKILLLPKDPNDEKNVIVEIRGGAGGEEAALFSAVLYRMYTMYAQNRGWKTETLNLNETELGGYKEISFMVTGQGAWSRLKYESGVHRVQRVPETEAQGRIHTSTATVAVLPEADEVELKIDPKDLQIDTFRSSGAGGQHINKTSSAIRITHLPTGMVVECQDERSQYKNKDKAMRVLRSRLLHIKQQKHDDAIASERRSQVGTGDRSERIRTYNYPQGRVTDHRIGLTLYRLEDVLNGALDQIIDPLIAADRAQQMKITMEQESGSI